MKKVVIPVVILAPVVALFLWLLSGSSEDRAQPAGRTDDRDARTAADVDANGENSVADDAGGERREADGAQPDDAGSGAHPESAAPAVAQAHTEETIGSEQIPEGHVLAEGTVVVLDEEENEHAEENGEFRIIFWQGNAIISSRQVAVSDGRWSVPVPEGAKLGIGSPRLGGRPAALIDAPHRFEIPEDGIIELRARWPRVTRIHVRSAETGEELGDLVAVQMGDSMSLELDHPGEYTQKDVLGEFAWSPIEIVPDGRLIGHRNETILVHSPGYAWARLQVDLSAGGERELLMHAGGDLEIQLVGPAPPAGTVIRLRREDAKRSRPSVELTVGDAEFFALVGLRAGTYRITAELGKWYREPRVIGSVTGEVVAGEVTVVELAVEVLKEVPRAPLTGELFVPSEWELEGLWVIVHLLDTPLDGSEDVKSIRENEMEVAPQSGGTLYRWDAGLVQVGRYGIGLRTPRYSISLAVGADGAHARMELPQPGTVIVTVVLKDTEEPIDLDSIHWHYRRPEGVTGGSLESVERDRDTGTFQFLAPLGPIVVASWGSGYTHTEIEVEVGAGITRVTLPIERSSGLLLSFFEGDTPVPWSDRWSAKLEAIEHDGRVSSWGRTGGTHRLSVTAPGRYRLKLSGFEESYLPVPDQEVEIPSGTLLRHTVHLEPKR